MKKRECIGVVLSRPSDDYQRGVLQGIYKRAFELDINVAVFYTPTDIGSFTDAPECEEQIFALPNPEKLYGIIYMSDRIKFKDAESIKERYRKITECPVICLDIEEEGFTCLVSTDTSMVRENIRHLYECHGCTDIAYMTGTKGHPHSEARLRAYYDVMAELGLEVKPNRTHYGDFWYNEGESFVKKLIESPEGLPQAISCASDRMAHSVCEALKKYGKRIPEDILVVGSLENDPLLSYLSSVSKNVSDAGYQAVSTLNEMRNGVRYEKKTYYLECDSVVVSGATCGCPNERELMTDNSLTIEITDDAGFFSLYNNMRDYLQESEDFTDFFWRMDYHTLYFKPFSHFSFVFTKDWDTTSGTKHLEDELFLVYSSDYRSEEGKYERRVQFEQSYDKREMHPVLWQESAKPSVFYFQPLYSKERCFGFAVLSYGHCEKTPDICYRFWMKDVNLGIEAQRRMNEIHYLYTQMQKSAITNIMSGLYNRNGFHSIGEEMLEEAKARNEKIAVIMADLNCLKYINDTFGHEAGDDAIVIAAKTLAQVKCANGTREENFRMGGDEFVKIIVGNIDNADVTSCINEIYKRLEMRNEQNPVFPVILSMGSGIGIASEMESVFELVGPADKEMLINKEIIKKKTNFDFKRSM